MTKNLINISNKQNRN